MVFICLHYYYFFVVVKSSVFDRLNCKKRQCLSKVSSGLQELDNDTNIKSEKNLLNEYIILK